MNRYRSLMYVQSSILETPHKVSTKSVENQQSYFFFSFARAFLKERVSVRPCVCLLVGPSVCYANAKLFFGIFFSMIRSFTEINDQYMCFESLFCYSVVSSFLSIINLYIYETCLAPNTIQKKTQSRCIVARLGLLSILDHCLV